MDFQEPLLRAFLLTDFAFGSSVFVVADASPRKTATSVKAKLPRSHAYGAVLDVNITFGTSCGLDLSARSKQTSGYALHP